MLKRSLKAVATIIFALSIVPSTIVCSAYETVATTTGTAITDTSNLTQTAQTTVAIANDETTETTLDTTSQTTLETTTDTETSSTTASETTVDTTLCFKHIEDMSTTSATIDTLINDDILKTLTYSEKLVLIQNEVDEYLYNTTTLTPDEALKVARKYIQRVCSYTDVSGSEILWLCKYANDIVEQQNATIESNKQFYEDLESTLKKVNYSNYEKIEENCKYLIRKGFTEQVISSGETIKLMKSIHSNVVNRLSKWERELIEYSDYSFISNQSLVTKWHRSYPDMQGWIYIADSSVDYPLMQYYDNNNYYLEHSWNGAVSSRGTIELDYRSTLTGTIDSTSSTENALIYGHNLNDNTMFSSLVNYKKESYYEEHQYIEISTLEGQRLYKVYAVCSILGLANGTKFKYWDDKYVSMDEETFNEHLELTKDTMLYDIDDFPEFGQDILTLQTCDGNSGWRVVIFAKRVQ